MGEVLGYKHWKLTLEVKNIKKAMRHLIKGSIAYNMLKERLKDLMKDLGTE